MLTITKIHRQMPPDEFDFKGKHWIKNAWEVNCTVDGQEILNAIVLKNSEDKWAAKNAAEVVEGASSEYERKDDKYNENVFKLKGKMTGGGGYSAPASPQPTGGSSRPATGMDWDKAMRIYRECSDVATNVWGRQEGVKIGDLVAGAATLYIQAMREGLEPPPPLSQDGPPLPTAPNGMVDDGDLPY